jgi:DNA-binding LytR/AlgR family response regulator
VIRVAICDDEVSSAQENEAILQKCLSESKSPAETNIYSRSDALLYDISEDGFFFDLILLDIEMPFLSGMELAKKIKPYLPNVKIIFVTSHIEHAIDAFELSIFRYVPKAELSSRLSSAINDALRLIQIEADKTYTVANHARLEKVPYKDILYIEKDGKYAAISSPSGMIKVRKSLQQVFDELNAQEFLYIDRGIIVNIIHVMKIKDGSVELKSGATLPISRRHLQEVKEKINAYWGQLV